MMRNLRTLCKLYFTITAKKISSARLEKASKARRVITIILKFFRKLCRKLLNINYLRITHTGFLDFTRLTTHV